MMQMISQFPAFMQQMRGQNPDAMIQQMVNSGKISRQQLDQVTRQANNIAGQMAQFKAMFGFR